MLGRLVGWAVGKAVEAALRYGKVNSLHKPIPARYEKGGEEKYICFVIVDEKKLGDGQTLIIVGDLGKEEAREIEQAIIVGIETGFKRLLKSTYEKEARKGDFEIIEDKIPEIDEDLEDVVEQSEPIGILHSRQYFRKSLSKYFKDVDYQKGKEKAIPKLPAERFTGGDYFLRWRVREGRISKSWKEYVAPVEGIGKLWFRVHVVRDEKAVEMAKLLYEHYENDEMRKKLQTEMKKYLKALIEGKIQS